MKEAGYAYPGFGKIRKTPLEEAGGDLSGDRKVIRTC
jgi:hypothetical protein